MVNFTAPKRMMNNDKLIVLELSDGFSVPLTGANISCIVGNQPFKCHIKWGRLIVVRIQYDPSNTR